MRTVRQMAVATLAIVLIAATSACGGSGEAKNTPVAGDAPSPVAPSSTAASAATPTTVPTAAPLNLTLTVAPDFTLPNANGTPVTLSELSAQKPVVLVFYRAFW